MNGPNGLFGLQWSPPQQCLQPAQEGIRRSQKNRPLEPHEKEIPKYEPPVRIGFGHSALGPMARQQVAKYVEEYKEKMAEQPTTNEHAYTVRKAPPRKEHPDRVAEREKVEREKMKAQLEEEYRVEQMAAKKAYVEYERQYNEWQKKQDRWAKAHDGHSLSNGAGAPPQPPRYGPKPATSAKDINDHVQACFQWKCGTGENIDQATPQCLRGPRTPHPQPTSHAPKAWLAAMSTELPHRSWAGQHHTLNNRPSHHHRASSPGPKPQAKQLTK